MLLYSLILLLTFSNLVFLMLIFINLPGVFTRRKVSEEKQDCCSVHEDGESKDASKPEVDLISNLPCSMIHKIFGCLHLHDIAKMGILSKEWKRNWLSCPELVFNYRFVQTSLRDRKLQHVIHHILSHHQGPLLKFTVQVPDLNSGPEINEWIRLLPGEMLQDLILQISIGKKHKLTSHLCSFQNLRNLRLRNCVFNLPTGFKGFSKLVNLDFQNLGLMPEKFGEFTRSCPSVESVRLAHCTEFDCLKITGPKLKFLEFVGVFRLVSFVNCPVLSDVRLLFPSLDFNEYKSFSLDLVKSLSCLPMLEELHLQAFALEDLVECGAPNKLSVALKSLKNLHIMDMYFEKPKEASSVISLIRSCPNSQSLQITAFTSQAVDMDSVAEFLQQQTTPQSLPHLKAVTMLGICGIEAEMQFLKFLLASAGALEGVVIRPHMGSVFDGGESILMKFGQYPRASPSVKIAVSDSKNGNVR